MAEVQMIDLVLGTEHFGVEVQQVKSIERLLPITPIPRTLPFILGVINLRDEILPVLDLGERLGFSSAEATEETRIVVAHVGGVQVGLVVDAVRDVLGFDEARIEDAPTLVGGIKAEYLGGITRVGEQIYVLLNLAKILSDTEAEQLRETEKSMHG